MTQIKAKDKISARVLARPSHHAKFKKPRTVVLLAKVAEAIEKQLAGRSKGWLFPSYR